MRTAEDVIDAIASSPCSLCVGLQNGHPLRGIGHSYGGVSLVGPRSVENSSLSFGALSIEPRSSRIVVYESGLELFEREVVLGVFYDLPLCVAITPLSQPFRGAAAVLIGVKVRSVSSLAYGSFTDRQCALYQLVLDNSDSMVIDRGAVQIRDQGLYRMVGGPLDGGFRFCAVPVAAEDVPAGYRLDPYVAGVFRFHSS